MIQSQHLSLQLLGIKILAYILRLSKISKISSPPASLEKDIKGEAPSKSTFTSTATVADKSVKRGTSGSDKYKDKEKEKDKDKGKLERSKANVMKNVKVVNALKGSKSPSSGTGSTFASATAAGTNSNLSYAAAVDLCRTGNVRMICWCLCHQVDEMRRTALEVFVCLTFTYHL
jgi:hypothetical protein